MKIWWKMDLIHYWCVSSPICFNKKLKVAARRQSIRTRDLNKLYWAAKDETEYRKCQNGIQLLVKVYKLYFLKKTQHVWMYVRNNITLYIALFVKYQRKMKEFCIFFRQNWQNQVHHNTSSPLSRSSQLINSKLSPSKYSNTDMCWMCSWIY